MMNGSALLVHHPNRPGWGTGAQAGIDIDGRYVGRDCDSFVLWQRNGLQDSRPWALAPGISPAGARALVWGTSVQNVTAASCIISKTDSHSFITRQDFALEVLQVG